MSARYRNHVGKPACFNVLVHRFLKQLLPLTYHQGFQYRRRRSVQ